MPHVQPPRSLRNARRPRSGFRAFARKLAQDLTAISVAAQYSERLAVSDDPVIAAAMARGGALRLPNFPAVATPEERASLR